MSKKTYNLHLKGYVGGWDFDSDYVDFVLNKNADNEVHVLIDSLGGSLATALSIVASFRNHGNVHVHYVGMNASATTIASLGAKHVSIDSSAMYLVHKCSMEFFQWASANADKLRSIIKEAEQMKENLDKMDSNIVEMYAKVPFCIARQSRLQYSHICSSISSSSISSFATFFFLSFSKEREPSK